MDRSESFARLCVLACEAEEGKELEPLFPQVRDIDDVDENGRAPLWYAAMENPQLSVLQALLDAGAHADAELVGQTVINNPNPAATRLLYQQIAPLGQSELDELFLLAAASCGDDELVRFFLGEGADPNAVMPMDLYPATRADGVDLADVDDYWWEEDQAVMQNALVVAMYENPDPVKMVRLLLKAGVDPNAIDSEGFPVLIHALDDVSLVHTLVQGGADPDLADNNGMTPLMHACAADNNEVVLTLLALKADVQVTSTNGETALHCALGCHLQDNVEVIRALIEAGCNVNQPDADGLLPLDIARFNYCSTEVMELLERSGAVMGSDLP